MAAAAANPDQAMLDYLQNTLAVGNATLRENIVEEGFRDDWNLIVQRTPEWVKNACSSIKKSGGVRATRHITADLQERLLAFVYWARLMYMLQIPMEYGQATVPILTAVYKWFTIRKKTEPTEPKVYSVNLNPRDWFESIENYLACTYGTADVPILYLVSTNGVVDPANVPPFTVDTDINAMLAQRGRHGGNFYASDSAVLWSLLHKICHGTKAFNCIEHLQASENGVRAYTILRGQYLGADVLKLMRVEADKTLKTIRFDGRSSRFPYDVFTSKLIGAIRDMGPEDQPSETRKVEIFLNAFQVPGLTHLQSTISANPRLNNSLDNTITFCKDQLAMLKTKHGSPLARQLASTETQAPTEAQVAAVDSKKGGQKQGPSGKKGRTAKHQKKGAKKFNKKNPAAYVTPEAWKKMSKEEQQLARDKRREQGIPTRNVSALQFADTDEVSLYDKSESPTAAADVVGEMPSKASNLKQAPVRVATLSKLKPTQRTQVYQGKPKAKNQVVLEELKAVQNRIQELEAQLE